MKPPFPYLGSKSRLGPRIVGLLPEHTHYVEAFAGSLAVLLAKPPSVAETINDLDGDLTTFWRVLRDRPNDLARACWLTPHSREEYYTALDLPAGEVEQARRVFVRLTQGSSRTMRHAGMWAKYVRYEPRSIPMGAQVRGFAERLPDVADRIRDVSIDSRPGVEMVRKYGRDPRVCVYLDPPYLASTRAGADRYGIEHASRTEHVELLEACVQARASIVLSSYPSTLYDEFLAGWERFEFPAKAGGRGTKQVDRTEIVWRKHAD